MNSLQQADRHDKYTITGTIYQYMNYRGCYELRMFWPEDILTGTLITSNVFTLSAMQLILGNLFSGRYYSTKKNTMYQVLQAQMCILQHFPYHKGQNKPVSQRMP